MTEGVPSEAAIVPVVCGIIERGTTFLAALRGNSRSNANLWEFPGGKIRRNETAETALVRELREELNIEVSVKKPLTPNRHTYPHATIELIPFICAIVNGEPNPNEHAEIRWLDATSAQGLPWAPADLPILKEYLNLLSGSKNIIRSSH